MEQIDKLSKIDFNQFIKNQFPGEIGFGVYAVFFISFIFMLLGGAELLKGLFF